ncbi:thiol:disulfide interchange protein [Streptosporangium jomthongense]|uniref:TlpA family protein disulfide reductase n=1 Tax=Marinobacter aromaticivorans TaxID=1494078 RepID=A0ABW2IQ23_9GAMM|nr:TlpA disulfide reductase family protein [Marinobacter aromaticivorans]GGE53231.1 thiol:disulfide interchange protein [Streptosporangium jomthongense]
MGLFATLVFRKVAVMVAALFCTALVSMSAFALDTEPAPDVNLPTRDGKVSLSELRGKVVLLDFWASWCGPCRQSFPWMNEMQAKYGSQGFEVVAINVDQKAEAAAKFLSQVPAAFTIAYDPEGKTPEAYNVMGMPSAYLIDRNGDIHSQHIGFHNDRKDSYEAEIQSLLRARN